MHKLSDKKKKNISDFFDYLHKLRRFDVLKFSNNHLQHEASEVFNIDVLIPWQCSCELHSACSPSPPAPRS